MDTLKSLGQRLVRLLQGGAVADAPIAPVSSAAADDDTIEKPWCYLLSRYGDDIKSPTPKIIKASVRELYKENLRGMTEADYDEHGSAALRFGYDEGPMYELEVTRHGYRAHWEEWADQDYRTELCPPRGVESISRAQAELLWNLLADGKIEQVRSYFMQRG